MIEEIRVANLVFSVDPLFGGSVNAVKEISKNLKIAGFPVSLYSFGDTKRQLRRSQPSVDQLLEVGIQVHTSASFIKNKYGIGSVTANFKNLGKTFEYDFVILHGVYSISTIWGGFICWKKKIPYAVMPHGSLEPNNEEFHSARKVLLKFFFLNWIIRHSTAVFVTDVSEKENLPKRFQKNTIVVGLGVDLPRVVRVKKLEINRLLFLGRIAAVKRLDLLLLAMPKVLNSHPNCVLTVAGDGPKDLVAEHKLLVDRLSIGSQVQFTGWLDGDQKRVALLENDIFVLPSERESFGIAVAEALSYGMPCVVSKNVPLARIVEKYGAGVNISELNPDEIAKAIIGVLDGDFWRMSNAAQNAAESEFEWANVIEEWRTAIEGLILGPAMGHNA